MTLETCLPEPSRADPGAADPVPTHQDLWEWEEELWEPIRASTDWVLAAPFRAHLRHLAGSTGLPWRVLAHLGGVEPTIVRHLLHGRRGRQVRRIHSVPARRLLAVTPATIQLARGERCLSVETRGYLTELLARLPAEEVGRLCRLAQHELAALVGGDASSCDLLTALLVRSLWESVISGTRPGVAPRTAPDVQTSQAA